MDGAKLILSLMQVVIISFVATILYHNVYLEITDMVDAIIISLTIVIITYLLVAYLQKTKDMYFFTLLTS